MADLIGRQRRIGFRRRSHWRHWRRAYLQCLVGERKRERTRKEKGNLRTSETAVALLVKLADRHLGLFQSSMFYCCMELQGSMPCSGCDQQWRTLVAFLSLAGQPQLEPHMGPTNLVIDARDNCGLWGPLAAPEFSSELRSKKAAACRTCPACLAV